MSTGPGTVAVMDYIQSQGNVKSKSTFEFHDKFINLLYAGEEHPLGAWDKKCPNGLVKRRLEPGQWAGQPPFFAMELQAKNNLTTSIICPRAPFIDLHIRLPTFVMVCKNTKKFFGFEIQVLDSRNIKRRLRFANSTNFGLRRPPNMGVIPLRMQEGWNEIAVDLPLYVRRLFGSDYDHTMKIQICANTRIQQIFFVEESIARGKAPIPPMMMFQNIKIPNKSLIPKNHPTWRETGPAVKPSFELNTPPERAPISRVEYDIAKIGATRRSQSRRGKSNPSPKGESTSNMTNETEDTTSTGTERNITEESQDMRLNTPRSYARAGTSQKEVIVHNLADLFNSNAIPTGPKPFYALMSSVSEQIQGAKTDYGATNPGKSSKTSKKVSPATASVSVLGLAASSPYINPTLNYANWDALRLSVYGKSIAYDAGSKKSVATSRTSSKTPTSSHSPKKQITRKRSTNNTAELNALTEATRRLFQSISLSPSVSRKIAERIIQNNITSTFKLGSTSNLKKRETKRQESQQWVTVKPAAPAVEKQVQNTTTGGILKNKAKISQTKIGKVVQKPVKASSKRPKTP